MKSINSFSPSDKDRMNRIVENVVKSVSSPDLYIIYDDGSEFPVYLSQYTDDSITASKSKKQNKSVLKITGKEIFLTPQAYQFYNQMDEKNKSDLRQFCITLRDKGTLKGQTGGEKISGTSDLFCIRLTQGEKNDRFFYVYKDKKTIIVFDGYTKERQAIATHVLDLAKRHVKTLMSLQNASKLISLQKILDESNDNNSK